MDMVSDTNFAVGPGMSVIIVLIIMTGAIAQWKFFEKCNYAGIYSIVPIWNLIIWMRILGRPPVQLLLFLIPGFNIYFYVRIHIDLCKMVGKTETSHYLTAMIFSIFYISVSGLSNDKRYNSSFLESKRLQ